jgi:hypothetical protein
MCNAKGGLLGSVGREEEGKKGYWGWRGLKYDIYIWRQYNKTHQIPWKRGKEWRKIREHKGGCELVQSTLYTSMKCITVNHLHTINVCKLKCKIKNKKGLIESWYQFCILRRYVISYSTFFFKAFDMLLVQGTGLN